MLKTAFFTLLLLSISIGGGAASVWYALQAQEGVGAVTIDGWTAYPDLGTPEADPYSQARVAREVVLSLGRAEGLSFSAQRDAGGSLLRQECQYRIEGSVPASRFWTLYAAGRSGAAVASVRIRCAARALPRHRTAVRAQGRRGARARAAGPGRRPPGTCRPRTRRPAHGARAVRRAAGGSARRAAMCPVCDREDLRPARGGRDEPSQGGAAQPPEGDRAGPLPHRGQRARVDAAGHIMAACGGAGPGPLMSVPVGIGRRLRTPAGSTSRRSCVPGCDSTSSPWRR